MKLLLLQNSFTLTYLIVKGVLVHYYHCSLSDPIRRSSNEKPMCMYLCSFELYTLTLSLSLSPLPPPLLSPDAPEITPVNSTTIRYDVALGSPLQLRCDYVGVPSPSLQWVQNNTNNLTSMAEVEILGGAEGDTSFSIVIDPVGRMSGGTFACVATNEVGSAMVVYSIRILSEWGAPINLRTCPLYQSIPACVCTCVGCM